jgi:serine/threonine-protein kinase
MSPEQATGLVQEIDGRTDLFGLGATMFRLLSGRPVHGDVSETLEVIAAATEAAAPLASVAPGILPDVAAIVDRSLAFVKHHRYPSAEAMRSDVRAVRVGQPPPYARAVIEGRLRAGQVPPQAPAPIAPPDRWQQHPAPPPPSRWQQQQAPPGAVQPAVRPAPTLIEPAAPAVTAPDPSGPMRTLHDIAAQPQWSMGKVALVVGGASLATGVIVGIVLVSC